MGPEDPCHSAECLVHGPHAKSRPVGKIRKEYDPEASARAWERYAELHPDNVFGPKQKPPA